MKKRRLINIFVICILAINLVLPVSASEQVVYEDGSYTYTVSNGEATIIDWSDYGNENEKLIIPSTLGGYPVTMIGDEAFGNVNFVTEIVLPEGVKAIGERAFYAVHHLETLHLPESLQVIGDEAFFFCTNLINIVLPSNLTEVGRGAFSDCSSLRQVAIPAKCKIIGERAFSDCSMLENITIANGVTRIEGSAFACCVNLQEIFIPESLTEYDVYMGDVFGGCINLKKISVDSQNPAFCSVDGVMFTKNLGRLVKYPPAKTDKDYTLPDNVQGFYFCFNDCLNLENIYASNSNKAFASVNGVLFSKDKTKLYRYPAGKKDDTYEIPEGTLEVFYNSFQKCSFLNKVVFPSSSTKLHSAFDDCSNLETVILNDGLNIENAGFTRCTNLQNITLPKDTTLIPSAMFYECSSLSSINIPDKVKTIEELAFIRCTALQSIDLPNGLERIEASAFEGCRNLKSLVIPENVKFVGWDAFRWCSSLVDISLSESIEVIEGSAFQGCVSLTTLKLPKNLTKIENSLFYACENLKYVELPSSIEIIEYNPFGNRDCEDVNIYYNGSENEWNSITGKNNLRNAKVYFNSYIPKDFVYSESVNVPNKTFKFSSGKGTGTFDYDDNYFEDSAYKYNHDLARLSIRVALAAYGKKNDYSNAYKNIEQMMSDMKFDAIYHNDWYEKKPTTSSIGVAIGKKHIAYPDNDCTLIAVAVRGGGYEAEWGGNFNVGTGNIHAGFKQARDQVIKELQNYIKEQRISGKIKLWITGYSRAAATTNLTAAYFDENPSEIGTMVTLAPKDIYAYCFETPMGVRNPDNASGLYNNIFSIVNQHDFVPKVAMAKWGYDRYGITKYLPTAFTNSNYNDLVKSLRVNFVKYHNASYTVDDLLCYYMTAKKGDKWTYVEAGKAGGMGMYLDNLMDSLADVIGNPSEYTEKYQEAFIYIGEYLLGYKNADEIVDSFAKNLEKKLTSLGVAGVVDVGYSVGLSFNIFKEFFGGDTYSIIKEVVTDTFDDVGVEADETIVDMLVRLCIDLGPADIYTIFKHSGGMMQGHYPELCLAWLDTIEESDFSDVNLRSIFVNCPVDLEVYDSNDKLVAAIYNNVPQKIEGSSIVAYVDENGQKVVYLPTDEEYRTEIIATDDGEVTYSVQEKNANTGATRVINYNNMTVKKDDTLMGIAENLGETEVATYALTSNSVTVEEPEVIENAVPMDITPVAEGNGNVSGGGSLLKGEYAQLVATHFENESFLGWYNCETLVSSDATYRFQVAEEMTLTAKFTENTCEILYLTDDEDVVVIDRILKGSKVTFPSITQNPNYMILDIYTDAEYTTLADENVTYSEDVILYVDAVLKNDWIQFGKVNNKVVVYSPTVMNNVQLMMALYEEEKLTELKPNTVDLVVGKNEFENLITNTGTADTLKIFVWNGLSTLKPLFKNCVVDLK